MSFSFSSLSFQVQILRRIIAYIIDSTPNLVKGFPVRYEMKVCGDTKFWD